VIAEHQKPLEHSERTSRPSTGGAGSAGDARHD
jgi:hypothetical protein